MLVSTSLKLFSPRGWSNWYERDWKYCLKWTKRPSAKDNADYQEPGLFSFNWKTSQSCYRQIQTVETGCIIFISIFVFHSLKSSGFCYFYHFKPEAYLQLKTASKLSFSEAALILRITNVSMSPFPSQWWPHCTDRSQSDALSALADKWPLPSHVFYMIV